MAKGKLALGLDIGSSGVKLISLKETKRRGETVYSLVSFGMKPLPPEAIVDGALMNSTAIVQAIQELIGELKIKQKEVAIGVSGHSVIIKKISMPRMTQEELEEAIQWEAEQHVPFDIKDVNIDTQILRPDANDATGQMDVLLVAAKKEMINDYSTVVTEAGLIPIVTDVDAFTVQNCFTANYDLPSNETIVLINAGAAVVNINIIANGITTFTRDITIGGNQFTEEIQKQLSVSYEEAEAFKVGGGRNDADAVVPHEVEKVMQQVADQVAGEIQRSLDFYAGTAADANFTKVYLSGGTAKVPALFKTIEQRVGVPVEILNPFKRIEIDNRKFDPAFIMDVAPQAAVAVGLALRRAADKGSDGRMININLLPTRQVQKRSAGKQYIAVAAAALAVTLLGNGYWYYLKDKDITVRKEKIATTDAAIARLEAVIKEVNDIKKRQAEVKEKLQVLDDLKKQRKGPVKVLDALIQATPKKVWITEFDEKGGALKVVGQAESFDDLSDFMRSLKSVVWTPKGMGRVVEAKRDGSSRVELVSGGAIEDFSPAETSHFFTNIDLKTTTSDVGSKTTSGPKLVKFELTLNVTYAI